FRSRNLPRLPRPRAPHPLGGRRGAAQSLPRHRGEPRAPPARQWGARAALRRLPAQSRGPAHHPGVQGQRRTAVLPGRDPRTLTGLEYFLDGLAAALRPTFAFDPAAYATVRPSLRTSLTATLLGAVAAVPLGILVALHEFPGRRLLLQTLNTLMALPTVMVGLLLYGLFTRQGPLGG